MTRFISKFLIFLVFSVFMGGVFVWLIYPTGARAERMMEKNEAEIDTLLEETSAETFSAEDLFEFDVFMAKVQVALDEGDYKEAKDLIKKAKKDLHSVENLLEDLMDDLEDEMDDDEDDDDDDDRKHSHKKKKVKNEKKHKKHHGDDDNDRRGWNGNIGHVDHGKSHKKGGGDNEGDGDAISSISQDQLLASIASSSDYYIRPIVGGRKSQGIHGHNAIDLAAPSGTPILAAAAGIVVVSERGSGYGNYIIVKHDNGTKTLYAHNSKNIVREGESVLQGEVIGYVGSTGHSTGPHVHFEVWGATNPF